MAGRLLAEFRTPQAIYEAKEECLKQIAGITKRQIASILTARSFEQAEKVLEDCKRKNISILTKEDERYPMRVKIVKDSPAVFYYQGVLPDDLKNLKDSNNSNNPNKTVAIVGNGLDICYPAEHERLIERIKENGLMLSEYPPGTGPSSYTFPQRNRLIAAWSDRLIVVAAGRGSGAMITAGYARQYGREVSFY